MFLRVTFPDADDEQIQEQLDACEDSSAVGLVELSSDSLTRLPCLDAFAGADRMKDLLVVRCPMLKSVAVDQACFLHIVTLVLDFCSLTSLPNGLAAAMPRLEVLSAEGNCIVQLPNKLPSSLVLLLLVNNKLRRVPPLGELRKLMRLNLAGNEGLPQSLRHNASAPNQCSALVTRIHRANRVWRARDTAFCLLMIRWCRRGDCGRLGFVPKELVMEMAKHIVANAVENNDWD